MLSTREFRVWRSVPEEWKLRPSFYRKLAVILGSDLLKGLPLGLYSDKLSCPRFCWYLEYWSIQSQILFWCTDEQTCCCKSSVNRSTISNRNQTYEYHHQEHEPLVLELKGQPWEGCWRTQQDGSKGVVSLALYQCVIDRQSEECHFAKACVERMAFLLLYPLDI